MAETTVRVPAKWTPDCQGKWDFDGSLVTLSTRYWPRGGGFHVMGPQTGGDFVPSSDIMPDVKPSAHATIYLGDVADEYYDDKVKLAEIEVEADTEAEVKARVEEWVAEQYERIGIALRTLFSVRESKE